MILQVILEHWREKRTSFGLKKRISLTCWSNFWTLEFFLYYKQISFPQKVPLVSFLVIGSNGATFDLSGRDHQSSSPKTALLRPYFLGVFFAGLTLGPLFVGETSTDFSFRSLKSCHMQRPKAAPHVAKCSDDEVGPFLQDGISMVTKMAFCFGFWVYLVMIETYLPIGRVCSMCRSKMMSMMILPRSPHGVDQQQKHAQLWESPVLSRQNWAFKKQDLVGLKGHVVTNPLIGNWDVFQSFCLSTYFWKRPLDFPKMGSCFHPFPSGEYFKHETKKAPHQLRESNGTAPPMPSSRWNKASLEPYWGENSG